MSRLSLAALILALAPMTAIAQSADTAAAPNTASIADPITGAERARIEKIFASTPLIDGHNDIAEQVKEKFNGDFSKVDLKADMSKKTPSLHTDIGRLKKGGVGGQFWSVYVPAELVGAQSAEAVHVQIDVIRQMVNKFPDVFELAESADDIVRIHKAGRIASLFGMEGSEAINSNLAILRDFRAEGVMYMTLCHSKTTPWIDSATDAPQHGGLAPFGEQVIAEMNRIGMLVDLSHVSAEAMRDVLKIARAPVIFSHSSAQALNAHPRNVPDDVLKLVAKNGGVVMVNFVPSFISEARRAAAAADTAEEARLKALNPGDPAAVTTALDAWRAANPMPDVTAKDVADHIEHIRDIAGVDHVGIGSDFDGIPSTPVDLTGVETYPVLFAELMRRGWSDKDLEKLAGGNVLRVMRKVEQVAKSSR